MLVALVTKECSHCKLLMDNWPIIVDSLLSAYPSLTFPPSVEETKHLINPFIFVNHNTIHHSYPSSLMRYLRKNVSDQWYPMILLVNKNEWSTNTITTPTIMNSSKLNDKIIFTLNYDTRVIDQFKKWLTDTLNLTPTTTIVADKLVCNNILNLISIY